MKTLGKTEFRLATVADSAVIATMSRDLIEYGLDWSWTASRVARHIRDREVVVLLATVDRQTAGFGIMAYADEEAHLKLLAVNPVHQHAGIGRQIVRWLERTALYAGTPMIYLELRAGNKTALCFYNKLGYRVIGSVRGYYCGRESCIRMGRDLWENSA